MFHKLRMQIFTDNKIFLTAVLFSAAIFITGLVAPEFILAFLGKTNQYLLKIFSTWYLWLGLLLVALALVVFLLPFGKSRLGNEMPEYRFFSWIALLYSTGMGSGLLFRAVQEPVYYYAHPPVGGREAQELALEYSFFHWGFTPWAMYSLFGLIVAYNLYEKKAGNYLNAVLASQKTAATAKLTNVFIALITVIGVIAALGLGAAQFIGGMDHILGIKSATPTLLALVFAIGLIATLSALTGIKKVIKILADLDLSVSIALMLFVGFFLDAGNYFSNTLIALRNYLLHFFEMSLSTGGYRTSGSFTNDWTVFYWAFWIAWVPFTGIFIARISRGRTVRQFLLATIVIPALATMVWFSIFGNKAIQGIGSQYGGQFDDPYTSLFLFLETLPLSSITIVVTALLVLTAIINSVDSAIFVLSMFSDGGSENPDRRHKITWGAIITATALGMTAVGRQDLLNAVSSLLIIMALPFSFLYVLVLKNFFWGIFKMNRKQSN